MEDILARLDKEYKVDAVLSKEFAQRDKSRFNKYKDIAENTIYNARSFDSKVPAETQKNIAEK